MTISEACDIIISEVVADPTSDVASGLLALMSCDTSALAVTEDFRCAVFIQNNGIYRLRLEIFIIGIDKIE